MRDLKYYGYLENEEQVKMRCFIYLADEFGFIKIWDLTSFIEEYKIQEVPSYKSLKLNFNPKRKETVDVSAVVDSFRKE